MSNCPRRTIGWSSCPVIRSQRRICCSCFDSCRSNFLLNRCQKSKPGTIAKSRERSSPVVPTFGAASQGFQYLGVTQPPQLVKSGYPAGPRLRRALEILRGTAQQVEARGRGLAWRAAGCSKEDE